MEKHFLGNIGVTNTVQNFMDRNAFYPKEVIKESRYMSLHFPAGQKKCLNKVLKQGVLSEAAIFCHMSYHGEIREIKFIHTTLLIIACGLMYESVQQHKSQVM